jgi:glycogen operon protein
LKIWPGSPHPLGAAWDGEGTNFALYAGRAEAAELCFYDAPDGPERERVPLRFRTHGVWHAYLPGVGPGQLYGLRVHGPFEPRRGLWYNPRKLLVDPCARALAGALRHDPALVDDPVSGPDPRDTAALVPKALVVDPRFDWGDDRPPRVPWHNTLVYELHVRGMTARHPDLPPELRGRYLGLAAPPVVAHLRSLGVTAVELLPVHQAVSERALVERGLCNYWGYNTLGYFAPDSRFASGDRGQQVREFKQMVKALHAAGIEVILDVVYNHTAEGGRGGPTLCWRGIDNPAYYRLAPDEPSRYVDWSGCGNSLNAGHPRALQLVMDSLRYWVQEMHVDGFRFDLAPVLTRGAPDAAASAFLTLVEQDPVLAQVKFIAEPWDATGERVGSFPPGWAEWNGRYRDGVRRFWRGDPGELGELAARLAGSEDLFGHSGRLTEASVNFVTCHDGFTLLDLVSFERKRNEANGDDNRDGTDANWSSGWGAEGLAAPGRVLRLRDRMRRNFLATLAFSQGVPMLSHGDELGRSQLGNNNAYCHDGPLTWVDWELGPRERELLRFARLAFAARREHPVLRRRSFFSGEPLAEGHTKDVHWLRPDGEEMREQDWRDAEARGLGMLLPGAANEEVDEHGQPVEGATLLLALNAGARRLEFALPRLGPGRWRQILNSVCLDARTLRGNRLVAPARSLSLLEFRAEGAPPR